ncbi:hypothetical protein, partial [Anditalea andensis]|uniref:hypothetical protein n=1 Tax=Anditalea andensis TaxID=1048983 RepID=UPI00054E8A1B
AFRQNQGRLMVLCSYKIRLETATPRKDGLASEFHVPKSQYDYDALMMRPTLNGSHVYSICADVDSDPDRGR